MVAERVGWEGEKKGRLKTAWVELLSVDALYSFGLHTATEARAQVGGRISARGRTLG